MKAPTTGYVSGLKVEVGQQIYDGVALFSIKVSCVPCVHIWVFISIMLCTQKKIFITIVLGVGEFT